MFIIFSHRRPKTADQLRGTNTHPIGGGRLSTVRLSASAPTRLDFEPHWAKLKKVMMKEGDHVV